MAYKCGRCGNISGDNEHWLQPEMATNVFEPIMVTCKSCQMFLDIERKNLLYLLQGGLKDVGVCKCEGGTKCSDLCPKCRKEV